LVGELKCAFANQEKVLKIQTAALLRDFVKKKNIPVFWDLFSFSTRAGEGTNYLEGIPTPFSISIFTEHRLHGVNIAGG